MIGLKYNDAFMERTPVLTRLEHLTLQGTKVTATGLKQLAKLPALKSLTLVGAPRFDVDDLTGAMAAVPNLRYVQITNWGTAKLEAYRLTAALPQVKWVFDPIPEPLDR